jgi:hypothetical protein
MSHMLVLHQYTAAPREIAILGLILALATLRPALASKAPARRIGLTLVVAAGLSLCASVHPLGQALLVQFGAVAATLVYCQPRKRRMGGLVQVAISLLLAVLSLVALRAGVAESSMASWPLTFDPAPAVTSSLRQAMSILVWPLIRLGFWGPLLTGLGRVVAMIFAGFLCAGAFWLLGRRRRWGFSAM